MLESVSDTTSQIFAKKVNRWTVKTSEITVTRLSYDKDDLPIAPPSKREEAVSVIVQLADFKMHRLWRNGELLFEGGHPKSAIAITDLREEWQCHHLSPFDNVRFNIPLPLVRAFLDELGRTEFDGFECPPGTTDQVMLGLAQAILPYLVSHRSPNPLFLEQIGLALLTHLTQTYGNRHFSLKRSGILAPWQEKRALEFLTSHASEHVSIVELAAACQLSRSYFIRAFKETFGKTPYRWVTEYRIAKVKELLLAGDAMSDVAMKCGFADQSHMTRTFQGVTGETPGKWRGRHR